MLEQERETDIKDNIAMYTENQNKFVDSKSQPQIICDTHTCRDYLQWSTETDFIQAIATTYTKDNA